MTQSKLSCFLDIAATSHFTIYNLPFGVFSTAERERRIGTRIGDYILDLGLLEVEGLLSTEHSGKIFNQPHLNSFAEIGHDLHRSIRKQLQGLLDVKNSSIQKNPSLLKKVLIPENEVTMHLPFKITGFSDFYASENHASNVGRLFRGKENPLLPNWKYLPVAYNGRASTIFSSGTPIKRPKGQIKLPNQEKPIFSESRKLDYELEMGVFIGQGNLNGTPIDIHQAYSNIFGLTLLNDWSARDIQTFEYQPLGPFLSKSFATSISPWVVTLDALLPFRKKHRQQIPETVDYLKHDDLHQFDIKLKVELKTKTSKKNTLCETNFNELYWTIEQMLAHHTVNNCIMQPGDLLGSGTISGESRGSWGSLLETTMNGAEPVNLENGEKRTFLEDGDTIIMSAYAENDDFKIGFGTLLGTIQPAD